MTFDKWYQEQINSGSLKHPDSGSRRILHGYWKRVEASGQPPTTAAMGLLIVEDLSSSLTPVLQMMADTTKALEAGFTTLAKEYTELLNRRRS